MDELTPPQHLTIRGASLSEASTAIILLHGRGAGAAHILTLEPLLQIPDAAYVAPEAQGGTWYPLSFLAPLTDNEPSLSRSLGIVGDTVEHVLNHGLGGHRIVLLGFSQGACLATEYAARNPRRYRAVIGLSGGLIGPNDTPRDYSGTLDGTPVFLGSSDPDPHVPWARVQETADVLTRMGADVSLRRYPGMPHTVNEDELATVRQILEPLSGTNDQT